MSAKRRSRNLKGSQTSLNHEMSFRTGSPAGFQTPSSVPKKTGWLDDNYEMQYDTANQAPTGMEAEPFSMQTVVTADHRIDDKEKPVGCWKRFSRGVRGLWKTRFTDDIEDPEVIVKTTLRELAIYLVFIVILCIMTFGMTNSTQFYFTQVMSGLFAGDGNTSPAFAAISSLKGFFDYAEQTLVQGLYVEKYYNDEPVLDSEKGYVLFENKILGIPRLRQVRVRNDSCVVADDFKKEIKECFAPYSATAEFTGSYGPGDSQAWNFSTESSLNGRSFAGQISTYGGGGFVQLLGNDANESLYILEYLKSNLWLDRGTRAVFIDFTVYNANINLFCVVTLLFEYPATGGCIPFPTYRTLKLLRYVTTMDHFVMACEGLFVAFILYYFVEEVIEIKKHRASYFSDIWNIFDCIVIIMGMICIAFNIYRTVEVGRLLQNLLTQQHQYANFESLSYWQTQFNDFVAVAVFISWIKIFKYISFNKTMTQLQSTLARCAKDIAGFAVMFFIIFLAYAQWGYLIFGTQVQDFSTYLSSIFTLFRIILGDFDFGAMENASRYLGPIFFITYVFFVFFVLINMFLAIINDTYAEVKSDLAEQQDEFQVGDYFKKGYDKMMSKLKFKREKIVDIQKALQTADANQDNKLDFEEWRAELKLRGHADAEIEAVFAQYDIDGDRTLNELEQQQMQDDLEGQKMELNDEIQEAKNDVRKTRSKASLRSGDGEDENEESDDASDPSSQRRGGRGGVGYDEFSVLARRVDRVEHSIGSIVSKIDAVLLKLEAMDKAKVKRRETMTRLLDSIAEQGLNGPDGHRDQMERLVREDLERSAVDVSYPTSAGSKRVKDSFLSIKEDSTLNK
ncbi:polycystin-2 isoform X1 [Hydra vulgaris]|uniref:polycystin-2 isoform X1 n=1 Tax=Hydra vulgaris TaxID=6087 RepID=UPI001F5F3D7C|nr:polycystin-2-like isoform X2 [Hydra vulgaris]XP_047124820.1 polycystin-2-like isoform X2 [Hydra vulgaris]XP_047124826.1 polycystin-2-like isoform X2 [Hydra vulgaris]XP_047124830.1 polycystin-2-like isoform X2 [Hydra vulgaris]